MSRFTIKNLMDVENSVGERMPGVMAPSAWIDELEE